MSSSTAQPPQASFSQPRSPVDQSPTAAVRTVGHGHSGMRRSASGLLLASGSTEGDGSSAVTPGISVGDRRAPSRQSRGGRMTTSQKALPRITPRRSAPTLAKAQLSQHLSRRLPYYMRWSSLPDLHPAPELSRPKVSHFCWLSTPVATFGGVNPNPTSRQNMPL